MLKLQVAQRRMLYDFVTIQRARRIVMGRPATIRERLAELEAAGVQEVILTFPDALQLESLRFFAREFIA